MSDLAARILIVDDEYDQMKALCDTLGENGYQTTGRTDGESALAALRESRFDLLLTDLMMPDMSGIALLRRALETDPSLFGIVMTGHGTIETAVEAMKTGAFDYILKPFKLSIILAALARALEVRKLRLENASLQVGLRERTLELETANRQLRTARGQLAQSAEMASLGELVAGVAHEIDKPLTFVASHRDACERYLGSILTEVEAQLSSESRPQIGELRERLRDMGDGLQRIKDLVAKLHTFSGLDDGDF